MRSCLTCSASGLQPVLDLGLQAVTNRFLSSVDAPEQAFPFALGQCPRCGLLQLLHPLPANELTPKFDWIRYNEAEGHLDEVVDRLRRRSGLPPTPSVGAVSFKDDSTLARLRQKGWTQGWRLDPASDLGITDPCAGLESIQDRLTEDVARSVAARRGAVDLLIVRHVLEHAQQPHRFAAALRALVKPGGLLLFEVPDCTPALTRGDYTMPWEEHVLYFTPTLLARTVERLGFRVLEENCYPYANENSLVILAQPAPGETEVAPRATEIQQALDAGQRYGAAFEGHRQAVRESLARIRRERGAIALFGAGHLGGAWINFFQVQSFIALVVDDHPGKAGLFMPGSRLPILPSTALQQRGITLCLTSLSAESEARVRARNAAYLEAGGAFASIFPGAPNSLSL